LLNTILGSLSSGVAASTNSYESIATVTVGSGGSASVSFTSIPADYTHLQVRGILRSTRALSQAGVLFRLNSDTGSNYSFHGLIGNGSSVSAYGYANQTYINMGELPAGSASSGIFGAFVVDILDYKDTNKYKTVRLLTGQDRNGAGEISFLSGNWRNTNAITSITIKEDISNMAEYSSFALYGIKGA
jgi:hypothetical protein